MSQAGGSRHVSAAKLWAKIAKLLDIPEHGEHLAQTYQELLSAYEGATSLKTHEEQAESRSLVGGPDPTDRDSFPSSPELDKAITNAAISGRTSSPEALQVDAKIGKNEDSVLPDTTYSPLRYAAQSHGGRVIEELSALAAQVDSLRPYPSFQELGHVDIQALTRSIESRLPAEVSNALDTLVIIAGDRRWGLPLMHCGTLVDALLDCLDNSLSVFTTRTTVENAQLTSYFELLYLARRDHLSLYTNDGPRMFDNSKLFAEQCVCAVMTILRNLAFTEINQDFLARSGSIADTLSLGLHTYMEQSNLNHFESNARLTFAKDTVTLLSLISATLVVTQRRTMYTLSRFLCSFAPRDHARRDSAQDPYCSAAVDAFAKLLARDYPNRQHIATLITESDESGQELIVQDLLSLSLNYSMQLLTVSTSKPISNYVPLLHHALIVAEAAADLCGSPEQLTSMLPDQSYAYTNKLTNCLQMVEHSLIEGSGQLDQDIVSLRARLFSILRTFESNYNVAADNLASSTKAKIAMEEFDVGLHINEDVASTLAL